MCQAAAGIRDHCVTGVQTCALPICLRCRAFQQHRKHGWLDVSPSMLAMLLECPAAKTLISLRSIVCSGGVLNSGLGRRVFTRDLESVVEGKRVDIGGRRIIKKKKK